MLSSAGMDIGAKRPRLPFLSSIIRFSDAIFAVWYCELLFSVAAVDGVKSSNLCSLVSAISLVEHGADGLDRLPGTITCISRGCSLKLRGLSSACEGLDLWV